MTQSADEVRSQMGRQTHSLHFRQVSTLRERFEAFETQAVTFELDDPQRTRVSFFKREENNSKGIAKKRLRIIAQAEGVFTINIRINQAFSEIENRRLPTGKAAADDLAQLLDNKGLLKADVSLPYGVLPDYVSERFVQIDRYLDDQTTKVYGLLKWRCNVLGEYHRPFYAGTLSCSRDCKKWYKFHPDLYPRLLIHLHPQVTERIAGDIRTLWLDGRSEPLCRQLYREVSIQQNDAPRSALVIVVAALEAGLKECIVRLQPEVRWLLEETQSPPLAVMLESYWPKIPGKKHFNGLDIVFSSSTIEQIRKAVTLRNKLVHGWDRPIDWRWLEDFVALVQDMLWIFDYVTGIDWALDYIKKDRLGNIIR